MPVMVLKLLAHSIVPSITLMKRKLFGFDMVNQFHGSWINFTNTGNLNKSGSLCELLYSWVR